MVSIRATIDTGLPVEELGFVPKPGNVNLTEINSTLAHRFGVRNASQPLFIMIPVVEIAHMRQARFWPDLQNLLNITFKANCNFTVTTNITITGLTRTQTNASEVNVSFGSSAYNASAVQENYFDASSSINSGQFRCAQSLVRSGRTSEVGIFERGASWNQTSGTLVLTVAALGTDVDRVYELSFLVTQPTDNRDFPRRLVMLDTFIESGEFDAPVDAVDVTQPAAWLHHMRVDNGTRPLFTRLPGIDELTFSHHSPFPGVNNVIHIRLSFDMMLLDETYITITGLHGMQSPAQLACDWGRDMGKAWTETLTQVFKPHCLYDQEKGHLIISSAPPLFSNQSDLPLEWCDLSSPLALVAWCTNSSLSPGEARRSNCSHQASDARLANISELVTYNLNLTMTNPASTAVLPLFFYAHMVTNGDVLPFGSPGDFSRIVAPLSPGNFTRTTSNVTTSPGNLLGVFQDSGALNIIDALTCLDLADATCEGHSQYPMGCTLGHKLQDCAAQSGETVLTEVIGCLVQCNQSSGTIGDDRPAVRSACCGLQCLDSCWNREILVKPDDLHTTCTSPRGGILPTLRVALWKKYPGGSGGTYKIMQNPRAADIVVDTEGELDFTEGTYINAVVTPGDGRGCGPATPWNCTDSAAYLNSSGSLARPVDLRKGYIHFTDLVLQNAEPGPYQIVFYASSLARAGFTGRVGFTDHSRDGKQEARFLATQKWPVGELRVRHTTDLCQCEPTYYMGYNATSRVRDCKKCPPLTNSPEGSKSRKQCTCITGYTDRFNAHTPVTELVEIDEIPYVTEVSYIHTLNCTNINECYDRMLGASTHNCDEFAMCQDTEGSFLCFCNPGYTGTGTNCSACPPATYKSGTGSGLCIPCPRNATSPTASSELDDCGCVPGYEISFETEQCEACTPGKYTEGGVGGARCNDCERGKYSDSFSATACRQCPEYSDSLPGSLVIEDCLCIAGADGTSTLNCTLCPPGSYKSINGSSDCILCEEGKYSGAFGATTCLSCLDGESSLEGSTSEVDCSCLRGFQGIDCEPCLPGTYKDVSGSALCVGCPEGTYNSEFAALGCTPCPPFATSNHSSDDRTDCFCIAGYLHEEAVPYGTAACADLPGEMSGSVWSDGEYDCEEYASFGHCNDLGGTDWNGEGRADDKCCACGGGLKGLNTFFEGCTDHAPTVVCEGSCSCPNASSSIGLFSGTFTDGSGDGDYGNFEDCRWLIDGSGTVTLSFPFFDLEQGYDFVILYECLSADIDECLECFPADIDGCLEFGTLNEAHSLTGHVSSSVTFSASSGALLVHFTSDYSETEAGFQAAWTDSAIKCPTSPYYMTDNATCAPCGVGTYRRENMDVCTLCPLGTYGDDVGLAACPACGMGTFSSVLGATECEQCGPGKYLDYTGAVNSSECSECPGGKYSSLFGLSSAQQCEDCPAGTYSALLGLVREDQCTLCDAGKFSASGGSTTPGSCQGGIDLHCRIFM